MDHMYYRVTSFLLIAAGQMKYSGQMKYPVMEVHLSPVIVTVLPMSTITLNCSVSTQNNTNFKINWTFNFNNTHHNSLPTPGNNNRIHLKTEKYWSTLTVTDAQVNNSGWYFCKVFVDIPKLYTVWSNGSRVFVGGNTTLSSSSTMMGVRVWIWAGAGVGGAVVIVLILFWILWRRKRYRETENPVYENTQPKLQSVGPKQPSPRPCVQTDQSKRILTASTTPMPARACEKTLIYQNMHPTTRSGAQKVVAPRTRVQTESKTTAYENVRATKPARKLPNKVRPRV
ncbi:uncharacterized protein LOC143115354 [Alosa pseudoharengus]|uniref:uncharacterized protein LOC143115354 n=1 Tax=Alosa pseudoharengus TaxID=34774 RepID=UPI003F8A3F54